MEPPWYKQIVEQPVRMLGINLQLTSTSSRGSINTASHYMGSINTASHYMGSINTASHYILQKMELSV